MIGTEPLVIRQQFESVLRAAQEGAEWAVSVLYRDIQPALLRYLRAQAPREAEDIASETWLNVATGLRGFSGDEAAFRAWVFTIARRRLIDFFRRASRRPDSSAPWSEAVAPPAPNDTETAALAFVATEAALALLRRLPPEQSEIVLLRVVGGLSAEQVGTIVGKRPGTVRVLQHRALRRLAQELTTERVTR